MCLPVSILSSEILCWNGLCLVHHCMSNSDQHLDFFLNNGLRQVNCSLYKVKSDLIIYLNPLPYVQRTHIHTLNIQSMTFLCTDDGSYMDQRNFEMIHIHFNKLILLIFSNIRDPLLWDRSQKYSFINQWGLYTKLWIVEMHVEIKSL